MFDSFPARPRQALVLKPARPTVARLRIPPAITPRAHPILAMLRPPLLTPKRVTAIFERVGSVHKKHCARRIKIFQGKFFSAMRRICDFSAGGGRSAKVKRTGYRRPRGTPVKISHPPVKNSWAETFRPGRRNEVLLVIPGERGNHEKGCPRPGAPDAAGGGGARGARRGRARSQRHQRDAPPRARAARATTGRTPSLARELAPMPIASGGAVPLASI